MSSERDYVARAGDYVFGLMNDKERARAERDLEIDPAFRDAVLSLDERLRAVDPSWAGGRIWATYMRSRRTPCGQRGIA